MLKIGDFSRLSQVSIKALRHYDALGLLRPAHIDPHSSYRYYTVEQLPRLNRILALKDLGLSLEQIAPLLEDGPPADHIAALLADQQQTLEQRIQQEQARLARVRARLDQITREGGLPTHEVVVKQLTPQPVVACRAIVPAYSDVHQIMGRVANFLAAHGIDPAAPYPWLALYHDPGYQERDVDVTIAAPLDRALAPASASADDVQITELPGADQVLSVVHRGAYEAMSGAYSALIAYLDAHALTICGPSRNLFLQPPQPDDPAAAVTEIQIPVG